MAVFAIPKKLLKRGELVILPREEYENMRKLKERLLWEERDTDEAVLIFEKEKKTGKLKKASSFSEILGGRKSRE